MKAQPSTALDSVTPLRAQTPSHADNPVHSGDCHNVARVLARIGDKWSVLVIILLAQKPRRFNELRRSIDGISQRMLTLTLRGLERDGLLTRHLTPVIPPRVDYQLTDLGRSLCKPVRALGAWAQEHGPDIERAQDSFDARQSANLDAD
jgi:DNA-binding HxlR family transcriptional regulator